MNEAPRTPRVSFGSISLLLLGGLLLSSVSASNSVNLAWDANTEPDLDGYKLNYGTVSGVYTETVDVGLGDRVGNVVNATLSDLEPGTYYIAVTAYNKEGLESPTSNEVMFTATAAAAGYGAWQVANATALGDEAGPADNPEGDEYDNALEYALMLDPGSGANGEPFCVELNPATGKIEASYRRPVGAVGEVTYTLEVVASPDTSLALSPWSGGAPDVVDNGDGSETVTYPDLEGEVGVRGMARLRVEIAGDPSGPHYTPLFGWDTQQSLAGSQTCSYPYATMSVFGGSIGVGGYDPKAGRLAAEGVDGVLAKGKPYYLEFTSGPFAGHRFDLEAGATTPTHVAIDRASPRNTLDPIPPDLVGAFAIRPALTLRELVNPGLAFASDDPDVGDRLYLFDGSKWRLLWAFDGSGTIPAQWTDVQDDDLIDAGGTVIGPAEGFFLRTAGAYLPVTRVGVVRQWPFACPLGAGFNLVGGGFPIDQSPIDRAMYRDDGDGSRDWFTASNDPILADQVFLWLGDENLGAQGYLTYFRVDLGIPEYDHWADQTNSLLTNVDTEPIFEMGRAFFGRSVSGHDRSDPAAVWVWPAPWLGAP